MRVLVTGVKTSESEGAGQWAVTLSGSFEYRASEHNNAFFSSMPHLSLCLQTFGEGAEGQGPVCVSLDRFNYYANMNLMFARDRPLQTAQLWLQATPAGGKIAGSDTFIFLDRGVPEGGWLLSHRVEEATGTALPNPCHLDAISVSIPAEGSATEAVHTLSLASPLAFQRALSDLQGRHHVPPATCAKVVSVVPPSCSSA